MDKQKALEGVRVADFSSAWAGPHCVSLLALMGAEVIKIESRVKPDLGRIYPPFHRGQENLDGAVWFNQMHRGSLSVTLNLRTSEGIELSKRIVALSDVVVENFRAGVADRLGIGYEALRQINPRIIMASLSGFGAYGPKAQWVTYGMHISNISGLTGAVGFSESPPFSDWVEMPDPSGGVAGTAAILAALHHRNRTGRGQYIDVSELETVVAFQPQKLMDWQMNGAEHSRIGNRDSVKVPHGIYPCRGEDQWISIVVGDEKEWQALCKAIGSPGLASDCRFSSLLARRRNEEALDKIISHWTEHHTKEEAMETLQGAGVAAMPTFTSEDQFNNEHLQERGFFSWDHHSYQGRNRMPTTLWHMSLTPAALELSTPLIGQHNGYVLGGLLGLTDEELNDLQRREVVY